MPFVPDAVPLPEEIAALRSVNARLREVAAAKDTEVSGAAGAAGCPRRGGSGTAGAAGAELVEFVEAVGRAGQAGAEVAAREIGEEAGPGRRGSPARRWR
jgi:hypothetical protein